MKALGVLLASLFCLSAVVGARLQVPPWQWNDIDGEASERVQFNLYSSENLEEPVTFNSIDIPRPLKFYNPNRPTKIIIHGWQGSTSHQLDLKNAILEDRDCNVILVNWHAVDTLLYPVAVLRVKAISRQVATVVQHLVDEHDLRLEDLHIIGHSLGAQISGLSAIYLNGTIGRITGLDPAGPLFKSGPENSLNKTHAAFVDVVHTCANVFGYHDPMGHADFYPNGGTCFQPGCAVADLTSGRCSHNRAWDLFRESVLLKDTLLAFPAEQQGASGSQICKDVDYQGERVPLGIDIPTSSRGIFCLATRGEEPYGYGKAVMTPYVNTPNRLQAFMMKMMFLRGNF